MLSVGCSVLNVQCASLGAPAELADSRFVHALRLVPNGGDTAALRMRAVARSRGARVNRQSSIQRWGALDRSRPVVALTLNVERSVFGVECSMRIPWRACGTRRLPLRPRAAAGPKRRDTAALRALFARTPAANSGCSTPASIVNRQSKGGVLWIVRDWSLPAFNDVDVALNVER